MYFKKKLLCNGPIIYNNTLPFVYTFHYFTVFMFGWPDKKLNLITDLIIGWHLLSCVTAYKYALTVTVINHQKLHDKSYFFHTLSFMKHENLAKNKHWAAHAYIEVCKFGQVTLRLFFLCMGKQIVAPR